MMSIRLTGILLMVMLYGCSSPSDEAKDATDPTAKKQENVWQDQVKTLDKARAVEQTLMDAQKHRDAEMRRQEQ